MSSCSRRSALALLAAAPLGACGFTPAFGPAGPARNLLGRIAVDAPADKNAFDLVDRLEERLGRTRAAEWRLSYKISTDVAGLAITPENATTRYNVTGRVRYELRRAGSEAVATSGEVSTFTAYAASGTTVSTATAREDAFRRLMRLLADQIVTDLIATSGRWSPG